MSVTLLNTTDDPHKELTAYARLLARVEHPFSNRDAELAAVHLNEIDFATLRAVWSQKVLHDPSGVEHFEEAYAQELEHIEDERSLVLRPKKERTQKSPGRRAPNLTVDSDPDQTLPITSSVRLPPDTPFALGAFSPLPPLTRARSIPRDASDPDATLLPTTNIKAALPFVEPTLDAKPQHKK